MRKCEDHDLVLFDLIDDSKREAIQDRNAAVRPISPLRRCVWKLEDRFENCVDLFFELGSEASATRLEIVNLAIDLGDGESMDSNVQRFARAARRWRMCARYSSNVIVLATPRSTSAPRRSNSASHACAAPASGSPSRLRISSCARRARSSVGRRRMSARMSVALMRNILPIFGGPCSRLPSTRSASSSCRSTGLVVEQYLPSLFACCSRCHSLASSGHRSLATTRESSFQWHTEFLSQHFARVNWPQSIPDHARSFNGSRPFPRPKDRHFASGSRFTQRRPRRAPLLFSIHCRVAHSHYGVAAIASRTSGTGTADGRGERNGLTKLGWIDRRRERCARGTTRRGVHQLVQNGEVLGALLASSLYTAVIGCAPRASAEVALGSPAVISRWVDKRAFPPRSVSTY
jgi:hypothetical protein